MGPPVRAESATCQQQQFQKDKKSETMIERVRSLSPLWSFRSFLPDLIFVQMFVRGKRDRPWSSTSTSPWHCLHSLLMDFLVRQLLSL